MKSNLEIILNIELQKAGFSDEQAENIIEKAKSRTGTYSDTPENRKLGRVGRKYTITPGHSEDFLDEDMGEVGKILNRPKRTLVPKKAELEKEHVQHLKLKELQQKAHSAHWKHVNGEHRINENIADNLRRDLVDLAHERRAILYDMEQDVSNAPEDKRDEVANEYGEILNDIDERKAKYKKEAKEAKEKLAESQKKADMLIDARDRADELVSAHEKKMREKYSPESFDENSDNIKTKKTSAEKSKNINKEVFKKYPGLKEVSDGFEPFDILDEITDPGYGYGHVKMFQVKLEPNKKDGEYGLAIYDTKAKEFIEEPGSYEDYGIDAEKVESRYGFKHE